MGNIFHACFTKCFCALGFRRHMIGAMGEPPQFGEGGEGNVKSTAG